MFEFVVPEWELLSNFRPLEALSQRRNENKWVTLDGTEPRLSAAWPSVEDILAGQGKQVDHMKIPLRDPKFFIAHGLRSCGHQWEMLLSGDNESDDILEWIRDGVDVTKLFREFKGNYKGRSYSGSDPQPYYQKNSWSCQHDPSFVARTLEERIMNGSLEVIGKINEIPQLDIPRCIMPLTLETSKLRLCHDERYLNLFIKDMGFKLDTLKDVPRLVGKGDLLVNTDEKSGYDHVSLSKNSHRYFGVAFAGWILTYSTLPFGFKAACYIYQRIGLVLSVYLRNFGIPVLQYIDDRLFNLSLGTPESGQDRKLSAILCLLTKLGYTLSIHKSILTPTDRLIFLGFWVDTSKQAFELPREKRDSFRGLRELALSSKTIDLLMLQKLAGKCSSMAICVPGALFYIREINRAISHAQKSTKSIPLKGALRTEIEYWRFLDTWHGQALWRKETHSQLSIATDASLYKWAGKILNGLGLEDLEVHDYFGHGDSSPIHVKEALAVLKTVEALGSKIQDSRLDVLSDNQALVETWKGQGSRSSELNNVLKLIFQQTLKLNLDLRIRYIPTDENPADAPSRRLSRQDATLSAQNWEKVQAKFGPHTCDLMSLDSNSMSDGAGALKHYTPYPTPNSSGVDVFAQAVELEENPYVFPPFSMVSPLLNFFRERHLHACTVVLPREHIRPLWWPLVNLWATDFIELGLKGETGKVKYPSKQGWILDDWGLPCDLVAFRMSFT